MADERVHLFNPGPAALPVDVLKKAQAELLSYQGLGYSVLEMSHRSKPFDAILSSTEAKLRKILCAIACSSLICSVINP